MKAKRIVSILLTGSMLLSLLPVSALAATPVFDAPAQTTAKKAAPLVQEADASRSTEEEAATRSSRDLDAENGTAESFTIQLNADGTPAGYGDGEHWYYSADSGCWLYNGVFALHPSSEAEAESALQAKLYISKDAEFNSGTVGGKTSNNGIISNGNFQWNVYNYKTISDGAFQGTVENYQTISGGTFLGAVDNYDDGTISGGYFVTMPEGSDTGFAAVSDQADRPFHVPVNGDFSENSYTSLFVPRGSSEQPNTITVKTNTKLLYYLADGERFPVLDSDSDSYIYQIPVQNFEKIVLVTEEPAPPTPDEPGDEIDPGFSSGAAALGIVLGTAGLGYITYAHISSLYLYYTLPGGFIPSTRQELANVLWTTAGKPDPVSTALYTDIPADAIEQQKAARWCVEQGLMSDYGATFGPDTTVTNARIIRAWNSLKKVPVPITN